MPLATDVGCDVGLASLVADGVGLVLGVHVYKLIYTVAGGGPRLASMRAVLVGAV